MTPVKKPGGDKGLSTELKRLLRDKDVEIRRSAVSGLLKVADRSTVLPLLLECLEDTDWRIRKTASDVLLSIKNRDVVAALVRALESENANARNAAADALVVVGNEAAEYLAEVFSASDSDVKKLIIDIIGPTGNSRGVHLLMSALQDEDDNIKATAIEYLGNMRCVEAVSSLLSHLKSENRWLVFHAVDALGKIGGRKAIESLMALLNTSALTRPVIRALARISDPDTLSSIVPFLKDDSGSIRTETLTAVGAFYLNGVQEEVIISCLRTAFGNRTIDVLKQHQESSREEVRMTSTILLGLFLDTDAIESIIEVSTEGKDLDSIRRVLTFIGVSSPEHLMPFFSSEDPYKVRIICEVAGRTGNRVFLGPLIERLKDHDSHVRANAAIALSKLHDPQAVQHIKPLMIDQYEDIQETAIKALSVLHEGLDREELLSLLSDRNPVLRKNAARLLGLIGERTAVSALGLALKDSDVKVRSAVIEALVAIDGKEVFKYLLQAINDEIADIRRVATLVLGNFSRKASFETLILLLHDPDAWVRAFAIKGIGRLKDRKAVNYLINLLPDDSGVVRTAAIEALAHFREERVMNALLKLLSDRDAEIRSTAIESLSGFQGISGKIIPLLKDGDWAVRKKAVEVLGESYREECHTHLKEIASFDDDREVRRTAARYISV